MDHYLIIVARDRPNLFLHLSEHQSAGMQVILDRRQTPRPTPRASGWWHTSLERDGYMVAATTGIGVPDRDAVTPA